MNKPRVFVFTEKTQSLSGRPYIMAIPEDQITSVETQWGSQNIFLKVNGREVKGSFDNFINLLGERVDFE
jgi:hypothetical protein